VVAAERPFAARGTIHPVTAHVKPRLRGVFHEWAFFASLGAAGFLLVLARGTRETVASSVYVAALAVMFGASALYHRISWSPPVRAWMRRLDHSTIFLFIAGTYTPFALLAIGGALTWVVLGVVWVGAAAGMLLSLAWIGAPKWLVAIVYVALGWVGVVAAPQLFSGAGVAAATLVAVGGVLYTVGAIAYATRRPDRWPATFGYHELFHVLVVAAAAVQFVAVALVVA
jgi:hemolysin III